MEKRSKTVHDWLVACRHRNRVNVVIHTAKSDFIKDELTRNKSNPQKGWITIHKHILLDTNSKFI